MLATNVGASGSAALEFVVLVALQPELVQVWQFVFRLAPLPFVPVPELVLTIVHTATEAPVGFHNAPVRSWKTVYVTLPGVVVGALPPEEGKDDAYGVASPSTEYNTDVREAAVRFVTTRKK